MKLGWTFILGLWLAVPALALDRFAKVSEDLYRSARPSRVDLFTLKHEYGIKTVLDLEDSEKAVALEESFAREVGVEFLSVPIDGFWGPKTADANAVLQYLSDPSRRPLLVHCKHGQDRTGVAVGLYRVFIEGMKPETAYREMLDRGFRWILLPLDHYFRTTVGMD